MATYWIKRPAKISHSWAILRRAAGVSEAVDSEELDAVNGLWQAGKLTKEQAEGKVFKIKEALRERSKSTAASDSLINRKVLEDYWQEEYATRILVDPDAMYNDLRRAVKAIEPVDLVVASKAELQAQVNKLLSNRNKHRRVVARINQLLKFLGRDVRLKLSKQPRLEVKYLSEQALLKLLPSLKPKEAAFAAAMFYTGCRVGEMFSMRIMDEHVVRVPTQVDRRHRIKDTKTGEARSVVVDPNGWGYVKEFIAMRDRIKRNMRHSSFSRATGMPIYALRHSYAIHMLNRGLNITDISLMLGNSVAVCNRFYTGFVAKPETLEIIKKKLV